MEKEYKVFFANFDGTSPKEFFPTRVLLDNFNMKIVKKKEDADVIVGNIIRHHHQDYTDQTKKNIIISGENIFFKRNLLSILESLMHRTIGDKKYKAIDLLGRMLPNFISNMSFSLFLKGYDDLLKKVEQGEVKNTYFVLSNESKSENAIIFPLLLQGHYLKLKKLIKKDKKRTIREKLHFCTMLVCSNSSRERIRFFKKLSKQKKVESYGKVMNNMSNQLLDRDWSCNPEINIFSKKFYSKKTNHSKQSIQDKSSAKGWDRISLELFEKYKFVICFENSFENEYITEKLPNVLLSGAIPIYRGAPNIGKYFNTKSFICYEDYGSYEKMMKKIIELDNDDDKYIKMLNEPCFKDNKIPQIIEEKEEELIKFYKKILTK